MWEYAADFGEDEKDYWKSRLGRLTRKFDSERAESIVREQPSFRATVVSLRMFAEGVEHSGVAKKNAGVKRQAGNLRRRCNWAAHGADAYPDVCTVVSQDNVSETYDTAVELTNVLK